MTLIAAIAREGRVWMGGDSAVDVGPYKLVATPKVIHLASGIVYGYSGDLHVIQRIVPMIEKMIWDKTPEQCLYELCWQLADWRKEMGYARASTEDDDARLEFIFGLKGRLFIVGQSLEVVPAVDNIAAMGFAGEFCLGVLRAYEQLDVPWQPEHKLREAMELTARYIANVRAPFHIVCTPEEIE